MTPTDVRSILRPDRLLRAEAFVALVGEIFLYRHFAHGTWTRFAVLFLVPDISLLAFRLPSQVVAGSLYNLMHTVTLPLALALFAWKLGAAHTIEFALIWLAHISFDRILGYGLKSRGSFRVTHIQQAALLPAQEHAG